MTDQLIAAAGAGRMGRGLAVAFAVAGREVALIDLKRREDADAYLSNARAEVESTLTMLAECGLFLAADAAAHAARVRYVAAPDASAAMAEAEVIFEGAPETLEAKEAALSAISAASADAIIASTTSTILSTDLEQFVDNPARFLNAHWLNPAYIIPLVELSPGAATDPAITRRLVDLLESLGKVPVVCKASPGFIVPRIQALAMNEAARLYEENVASPEDIDKATTWGLGFRFAVLGMLEFIDFGGGDILHHASRYMADATGEDRFEAPEIVKRNMAEGRLGLRTGSGFLDYEGMDVDAYRLDRMKAFTAMLRHLGQAPKVG